MSDPIRLLALAGLALTVAGTGCAQLGFGGAPQGEVTPDSEVYRRAEEGRHEDLEREHERLKADLHQAEEAMVAIESGQRGDHTRANAVSAIAEARIALERAGRRASWRADEIREAEGKLEAADRQLRAGHFGSAVFFASRAQRVADALHREARLVESSGNVRFVRVRRLNLRAEPSKAGSVLVVLPQGTPVFSERAEGDWALVRTADGKVGWVFASLLSRG